MKHPANTSLSIVKHRNSQRKRACDESNARSTKEMNASSNSRALCRFIYLFSFSFFSSFVAFGDASITMATTEREAMTLEHNFPVKFIRFLNHLFLFVGVGLPPAPSPLPPCGSFYFALDCRKVHAMTTSATIAIVATTATASKKKNSVDCDEFHFVQLSNSFWHCDAIVRRRSVVWFQRRGAHPTMTIQPFPSRQRNMYSLARSQTRTHTHTVDCP